MNHIANISSVPKNQMVMVSSYYYSCISSSDTQAQRSKSLFYVSETSLTEVISPPFLGPVSYLVPLTHQNIKYILSLA